MSLISQNVEQHEEQQYLGLIRRVLSEGATRPDRTGTGTISIFAPPSLRFSLRNNALPLLTTKRVFFRAVLEELLWFVRADTDSTYLSERGVKIWDGNGSREFLDKRGLSHRRVGDLGPVYGFQWRHFGATYETADTDYTGKGVDQLREVIRKIKEDPTDRRIIMSAWNPAGTPWPAASDPFSIYLYGNFLEDLSQMALPPCHMFCQFYVHLPTSADEKPRLSCLMYQRSADLGLGIPFNIASYALLTRMIAQVTNTEPHELIIQLGDAHVYRDHVDALGIQVGREPRPLPTLRWARDVADIDDFKVDDFLVEGYAPHGKLDMKMSV